MLWEECSELLLLVIDPLHPTLHYVYMECFELLLVEMLTLHYVDRKCFELLLVEMLVSLSYFISPSPIPYSLPFSPRCLPSDPPLRGPRVLRAATR
ncbi:unnamed protein product [Closterium sp. Naga37s-1]|nr:unnamed protein product [Closterium sp. Naga37s-1]